MKEAYIALTAAANQAGEDYEKYKSEGYQSYVYANKKAMLTKAAEHLQASGDIQAELKNLRTEYAEYSHLVEEESVHPTFDWAGEHVWEMVYTGRAAGIKQAITILESLL